MTARKMITTLLSTLLISVMLTGCSLEPVLSKFIDNQEKSDKKEVSIAVKTTDGKYELQIPEDWKELKGKLNDEAIFEYGNIFKEQYLVVIPDSKLDVDFSFEEYHELIRSNFSNIDQVVMDDSEELTIDGNKAYSTHISGTVDKVKIHYWVYTVDAKEDYVQIVTWTLNSKAEKNKEVLNTVAKSLKQVAATN